MLDSKFKTDLTWDDIRPRSHSLRWSALTKTRSSGAVLRWVRTVKVVQEVDFWTAPEDHLPRWSWGAGLIKSGLERSNVQCERKRTLNGSELVTFRAKHVVRYIRFVFRARKNWSADLSCHSNKTTLTHGAVWAIKNCSECVRSQTVPQDPFLWSGLTKTTFKVSENRVILKLLDG